MDGFFETLTGVSLVFALGFGFIAVLRSGTPRGRTFSDLLDVRSNWKALIGMCAAGFLVGIIGQVVT